MLIHKVIVFLWKQFIEYTNWCSIKQVPIIFADRTRAFQKYQK